MSVTKLFVAAGVALLIASFGSQSVRADDLHKNLRFEVPTKSQQAAPERRQGAEKFTPRSGGRAALAADARGFVSKGALNFPDFFSRNMADGYDTAVAEHKLIVAIFAAATSSPSQKMAAEIRNSSRFAELANCAQFIQAEPESELVAKNMADALGVDSYPTLSILLPDPDSIYETHRFVGFRDLATLDNWLRKSLNEATNDPNAPTGFKNSIKPFCPALTQRFD